MNEHLLFKKVEPLLVTKLYIPCPYCNKPAGTIDHLKDQSAESMWYCDYCGSQIAFKLERNGNLQTALTGQRVDKTLVLLQTDNVGLVVEGMRFSKDNKPLGEDNDAYFYNEHTCPTNYLPNVKAIIDLNNDDTDPHGIFQYVCTLPWDSTIEECNNDLFLESLVLHFQKKVKCYDETC